MKRLLGALLAVALLGQIARAEVTSTWSGQVSVRYRSEVTEEYGDVNATSHRGELLYTTTKITPRVGYTVSAKFDLRDNLKAGLTLRSGLSGGSAVMLQEITSREGLLPGLQEAYIDWTNPLFRAEIGKIPQAGTAMWDVYAASLQTDTRADDPRDGIFNDRMAALNGARLSRTAGPVTLRAIFHTDYISGYYRENEIGTQKRENFPNKYTILVGGAFDMEDAIFFAPVPVRVTADFDYGFPYRATIQGNNPDSTFADEKLWGASIKLSDQFASFQGGYGYNWRDSVFTIKYYDWLGQLKVGEIAKRWGHDIGDLTFSIRYQTNTEALEYVPYKGSKAKRDALHLYCNATLWGLDFQPRAIFFTNKVDSFKQKVANRYELTTTVKF